MEGLPGGRRRHGDYRRGYDEGRIVTGLPAFLPDGKHYLYLRSGAAGVVGIYAGSLDAKPKDQSRERILAARSRGVLRQRLSLFHAREHADGATIRGRAAATDVVSRFRWPRPWKPLVQSRSLFRLSRRCSGISFQSPERHPQLTWFDRQGKILSTFGQPTSTTASAIAGRNPRCGPRSRAESTGEHLAPVDGDLGLSTFERATHAFHVSAERRLPRVWSPDGRRIAFAAGNCWTRCMSKPPPALVTKGSCLKEPGRFTFPPVGRRRTVLVVQHRKYAQDRDDLWVCRRRAIASPCSCWAPTSTNGEHASRPTCTGSPTSPTRPAIERCMCARSWLRGHPARLH